MKKMSYISIAEADYQFLKISYNDGRVSNLMAYTAQDICERFLKGIIVCAGLENQWTSRDMHTHSIRKLVNFLKQHEAALGCHPNYRKILQAEGFYYNTQYPGDDFFYATKEDIDDCFEAIEEARRIALLLEQRQEQKKSDLIDAKEDEIEME